MHPHRNTGAPFKREDGSLVRKGDVFVPTEQEYRQRRYKLKPVSTFEAGHASRPLSPEGKTRKPDHGAWPLTMAPERYLELHPAGPHAELARRAVVSDAREQDDDAADE